MPRPETIDPYAVYATSDVVDLMRCDKRVVYAAIERGELRTFLPNGLSRGHKILGYWIIEWMESGTAQGDES